MEVVTNELGIREGLGHQYGGPAMAAPDVGHLGAALQLVDDAVKRGEPIAHQIVVVAGSEKARRRTEEAACLIAPGYPGTGLECWLDLLPVFEHRCHYIECPDHADGTVFDGKDHGLLRGQGEFLRCWLIGNVVRGRLMRQPFAQIALVDAGCGSELGYGHWAALMQGLVKSQRVADAHQRNAGGTAEVR